MTFDRIRLATLPTPLVRAQRLERVLESGPIWIKRDDLTGFATAGNKARPLEFLIAEALNTGAHILVAGGSAKSHFCAGAAVAARVAGLDCEVLYAGAEPSPTPINVQIARAAGARTVFDSTLEREDLDQAVFAHADQLRTAGKTAYAVPRGGATAVGALGFAFAFRELAVQCEQRDLRPQAVIVPTGSGGTQAGLVAGQMDAALSVRVIGASVSRPVDEIRATMLVTAQGCARRLGVREPSDADIDVRDVVGPGFGVASSEDRVSADLALTHEGLLLDETYTAKSMTLLRELVKAGGQGPMVFWHTGGLTAALEALIARPHCGESQ